MDNIKKIIESLHPLERKIVPFLDKADSLKNIAKISKLKEVEAMRALQWLSNKNVLNIKEKIKEIVEIDLNGKEIIKKGFPEKRFLEALSKDDPIKKDELIKKAELSPQEFGVSMGILKKNSCIIITEQGIKKTPAESVFLKNLKKTEDLIKELPKDKEKFKDDEKQILDELKKRKIIDISLKKTKKIILTKLGKKLSKEKISDEKFEDRLTHEMLKNKSWKDKKFRSYDVSINVPEINSGKRHFVDQAIDYIKKIWLELGFKEMQGTMIQTSFWDLDSLFVPQDHPARAMQDTFYIKDFKNKDILKGDLPKIKDKIKKVHEDGSDTGSKGWGGNWSEDTAKECLLRTHTTVISAKTIAELKKTDLPAKFFSVGKVFRNEALDWKHLFEFYQVEGIVVDPDANMSHLKGYLKEFYKKMGYTDVRMRPAHFPYTEPSVEVEVFHPVKKQWVELGGAGIFRPEVTKPLLGFECPVLAWGQGMARIIAEYWNITDIRDLYKNDLKQIKSMRYWMK